MICSVCGSSASKIEFDSNLFRVALCLSCGHRDAVHAAVVIPADYYENTPQEIFFVRSLEIVRRRQARELIFKLISVLEIKGKWFDFGCGRGWFLEESKVAGVKDLAGFDASELSTKWLKERGFFMADAKAPEALWPDWSSLPFAPQLVTFLDVLEHFDRAAASQAIDRACKELPTLKYIVIKVPCADGILFRIAKLIRGFAPEPYEQLFQAGTFPPHFHYFCENSLEVFLQKCRLKRVLEWKDPDADNLFHRIPSMSWLPGGRLVAKCLRIFSGDSKIIVAEVSR